MNPNQNRKIKEKITPKSWNETKTNDSWGIFKIMSEFVEGYEKLINIWSSVSIFRSTRTKPDHKYCKLAEEIGFQLTQNGYGVINVGRPGIMQAGNKGAHRGKGTSVSLNIELPFEQNYNPLINKGMSLDFETISEEAFDHLNKFYEKFSLKPNF